MASAAAGGAVVLSPSLAGCLPAAASWPVMSSVGAEFGMAVAAGLFADAVKELGVKMYEEVVEWTNDSGDTFRIDDDTEVLSADDDDRILVAAKADPVSNLELMPLVVLATESGHRIDLLPRAAQALAATAKVLAEDYTPAARRDMLMPIYPSDPGGSPDPTKRRSVTWMTKKGWVTILHAPGQRKEIVTVGEISKSYEHTLSADGTELV